MTPDERKIGALEESPISFQLSGPNERLRRHDQPDEESASSEDSVVQSQHKKPRRRLTRKEKGKMKAPKYDTKDETLDQREVDTATVKDGALRMRS